MKRILPLFIALFFGLFFFIAFTPKAHALNPFSCIGFPPGLNLPAGCPCGLGPQCASGACVRIPATNPVGICLATPPPPDDPNGGVNPVGLKRVHFPPPMPPCADQNGIASGGKCNRVKTSIGDIETEPGAFVSRVFGIMLAAAGAIALLLIMRAGYRIMTARGNPEGIQQGREQLVAAIVGLMFLVFSFVILQVITVDLLKIPGTSGTSPAPGDTVVGVGAGCDLIGSPRMCEPGLACVASGGPGNGVCKVNVGGRSCDMAGNGQQCPNGQVCQSIGASRAGACVQAQHCSEIGGASCGGGQLCRANGVSQGGIDCPTGEVCCLWQ